MHSETSFNSGQQIDDCMHECGSGESRGTKDWMITIRFIHWGLQAGLPLTVNCKIRSCFWITGAFQSHFHWTSLMMEIGSHNLFSETSFGGPILHWVKINSGLHPKYWKLRPLWVCPEHEWAWIAGHLVESLSRICLLRFWLASCSSSDRPRWCRNYFWIWKQRSKYTTRQYWVKWGL
jgi:hypothetical protein